MFYWKDHFNSESGTPFRDLLYHAALQKHSGTPGCGSGEDMRIILQAIELVMVKELDKEGGDRRQECGTVVGGENTEDQDIPPSLI